MEDLHRQQQASALYKQQRAAVEESLYDKIKMIREDRNSWKDEASRLLLESERFQRENLRLRRAQTKRDIEIAKSRLNSQEVLDQETSTATSKIEELKAEIADWKDKVAAHRDLESENTKLEFNCKRLEMKLAIADERNRTMSKSLTQMVAEKATNGVKKESAQPKFRLFLDNVANTHANELSQLKDTHESLVRQYRALERQYRDLQVSVEAERREMMVKRKMLPLITESGGYRSLLDDGRSIDTRSSRVSSDPPSSIAPSEYAPSTVISDGSRTDTIQENFALTSNSGGTAGTSGGPISPVQSRPLVNISGGDSHDPFTTALQRRVPTTNPPAPGSKPVKIKPNSEIRIYGR
jgi:hypothetical protein